MSGMSRGCMRLRQQKDLCRTQILINERKHQSECVTLMPTLRCEVPMALRVRFQLLDAQGNPEARSHLTPFCHPLLTEAFPNLVQFKEPLSPPHSALVHLPLPVLESLQPSLSCPSVPKPTISWPAKVWAKSLLFNFILFILRESETERART